MRNLWMIMRNCLDEEFGISRFRFEKIPGKRMRSVFGSLAGLLALILVFGSFYILGVKCTQAGYSDAIPLLGYVIGTVISFVMTILKINEALAGKSDAEFLMAMPIPAFTQVLAIFFKLYLWNLFFVLLTNVPMIHSYARSRGPGISFWIFWSIGVLMTSLPVTGVAALAGTFLALVLAGIKNSNLIHSVITLTVFAAATLLLLNIGDGIGKVFGSGQSVQKLIEVMTDNYKLGSFYQSGIVEQQGVWMALFLLLSVIWNLFFLFFMGISYEEVVQALREPKTYRNFTYGIQRQRKMEKALFDKEMRQWLHSRSYMVSSLLGMLFALLLSLVLLIKGPKTLFLQFGVSHLYGKCQRAVPFLLAVFTGAGCTTYCSYSIERRRHWIAETMPIEENILKKSKWKWNLLITLPASVLCAVLLVIAFRPGFLRGIFYFLVPAGWAFFSAWWGLVVDMRFADYTAESENQVLRGNPSFFAGWLPGVLLPLGISVGIFF